MRYADVILPLPLQGTFTYAVPDGMAVKVGMRVMVPLGRSKSYVGLVDNIHDQRPQGYDVKAIAQVMDDQTRSHIPQKSLSVDCAFHSDQK